MASNSGGMDVVPLLIDGCNRRVSLLALKFASCSLVKFWKIL